MFHFIFMETRSGRVKAPPHLRLETVSARNGPGPVSRKPPPESSVPGDTLGRGEGGGINSVGDMEARRRLARFLTSLAPLRASKSANGPRRNSFRPDSPSRHSIPGTEDSDIQTHHTGPGPFRTRPPTSVKSPTHSTSQSLHPPVLSSNIPYLLHSVCSR